MPTRIIVLGAGMIGSAVAIDLAGHGFDVTIADAKESVLERLRARATVDTIVADLASPAAVAATVAGHDVVVGALPSALGLPTLRAVIDARKTYCDISFMQEHAWELDGYARQHGVTAVVDCGLAPGVSNVLAGWAATHLQPCERIEILAGGLPVVRCWPFEYKAGFAPSDVIEEYTRPARIVEHGQIVVKEALSEPELVDVPGIGTLEAVNTDGLRSLAYTLEVPFMKEKTLRYPGHVALMRAMRDTGFFSKAPIAVAGPSGPQQVRPIDVTAALMFPKWAFDEGEADVTVLRVSAEGLQDNRPVRHVWDLIDRHDPQTDTRSMSRTTGYSATSMVALLASGAFTRPGVHPPELIAREPGLVEQFLRELARRAVRIAHREESLPG